MIEAYKIAANLTITGDAHKKMMEFYLLIEKTSTKMQGLIRLLRLTGSTFGNLNREARSSATAMRHLDTTISNMGNHTTRVTQQVDRLRRSVNALGAAGGRAGRGGGGGFGMGALIGGVAGRYLAPATLGYEAYNLTKAGFHERGEYNAGIAKVKAMGYGASVVNEVTQATGTAKPGLSPTTQMNAYVAALMATQSPEKAKNIFPTIARAMTVAPAIFSNMNKHQFEEATRAAEILSGGDEKKMQGSFSDVLAMVALSGGTIQPAKIKQLVRKNPSLSRLGMLELEPVVQEMGGDVVSTALRTGKMQMLKGQMGKYQALGLHELGILGKPEFDKNGRPLGSKYGNMKPEMYSLMTSNPTEFLKTVVLPALASQGINEPEKIAAKLNFLFANTYGQLFENIYKNLPKSNMIAERAGKVPGIEGLEAGAQGAASVRMTEAMKSFTNSWGKLSEPAVIKGMNQVSSILEGMANMFTKMSNITLGTGRGSIADTGDKFARLITGTYFNKNESNSSGHVYLDSKKVGSIMFGKTSNQMVDHGTLAGNPSLTGMSPGASSSFLGGSLSI